MVKENVILVKSYQFGLRIVKLHLHLSKELKQFEISSQILRSGTSIGANVEEASIIEISLAESLLNDCEELLKILFSIINTSRKT